jgi:hypothetical protein
METGGLWKKLLGGGLLLIGGLAILWLAVKLTVALVTAAIPLIVIGGGAYLGYRWWKRRALKARHDEGSERW